MLELNPTNKIGLLKQQKCFSARFNGISAAGLVLLSASTSSLLPAAAHSLRQSHVGVAPPSAQSPSKSRVIVTFTDALSSSDRARLTGLGCDIYRNLDFIHSAALTLPQSNLAKLSALSFVKNVTPDATVKKTDAFTLDGSQAGPAYASNNSITGAGVTVALIDSGIASNNADLQTPSYGAYTQYYGYNYPVQNRILANLSMIAGSSAVDQCGHGTHVAGIIAGNGQNSTGFFYSQTFYGIARNANLVNLRVLDQNGSGVASNVISALQWCTQNKTQYNIRVINMSLGMPVLQSYTTDPLCMAVEAAWKAGIVVVCAAGNEGRLNPTATAGAANYGYGTNYGSIESPGNDPYVITVGATKRIDNSRADDLIASYSSRGPTLADCIAKPDIVAPGNKVISDLAPNSTLYNQFGSTNAVPISAYTRMPLSYSSWNYFTLSGTSMAAPVVAGAAALLIGQNPKLSPDTVKARLMMTADPMTLADGTGDICTYGGGYLNVVSALKSTIVATSSAMSPTLIVDANGNVKFVANSALYGSAAVQNTDGSWSAPAAGSIWGTGQTSLAAIYGGAALTGPSLVNTNRALWGDTSLASSASLVANRALWGDSGLAASRALWGDSSPAVDLTSVALNGE